MSTTPLLRAHRALCDKFGEIPPPSAKQTYFSIGFDYPDCHYEGMPPLSYDAGLAWNRKDDRLVLSLLLEEPTVPYWKGLDEYFGGVAANVVPYLHEHVPPEGLSARFEPYWLGGGSERTLVPAYVGSIDCRKHEGDDMVRMLFAHLGCGSHALFLSEEIFRGLHAGERPTQEERLTLIERKAARLSFLSAAQEGEDEEAVVPEEEDEQESSPETPRPN